MWNMLHLLSMKTKELIPGMRIVKTAVAIFICLLIGYIFNYPEPQFSLLACVLMMKSSIKETISASINRTLGTVLGGVLSLLAIFILNQFHIDQHSILNVFIIPVMIVIALTLTKDCHLDSYVGSMACIVICVMMLGHRAPDANPVYYVGSRVIETVVGIVVAGLVNKYFNFKPSEKFIA